MLQEEGHCHERGPIYGRGVPLQDAPGLATRALNTPHDRWELVRLHTFDNRDDASVRFASMHGSATLSGRTEEVDVSGLKRQPKEGYILCHTYDDIFSVEVLKAYEVQTYHIQQVVSTFGFAWGAPRTTSPTTTWRPGLCHINHHVAVHSMVSRI